MPRLALVVAGAVLVASVWGAWGTRHRTGVTAGPGSGIRSGPLAEVSGSCAIALAPHGGETRLDRDISGWQTRVRQAADRVPPLERLGWAFVGKARVSFDPGYYRLAEQCALCIESTKSRSPEALLLRGHVLH